MSNKEKEYFSYNLTELIDLMSNLQIKETKLNKKQFSDEIRKVQSDIDKIISQKKIMLNSSIVRKILFTAVSNLLVWEYKDEMLEKPLEYSAILKKALEINSIRNTSNNALMRIFMEDEVVKKKITKFTSKDSKWVSFMKEKMNE